MLSYLEKGFQDEGVIQDCPGGPVQEGDRRRLDKFTESGPREGEARLERGRSPGSREGKEPEPRGLGHADTSIVAQGALMLSDLQIYNRVTSCCEPPSPWQFVPATVGEGGESLEKSRAGDSVPALPLWSGHLLCLCPLRLLPTQRGLFVTYLVGTLAVACDRTPTPAAEGKDAKQAPERKGETWWSSFRLG